MAVNIKIEIKSNYGGNALETIALVNSGFRTDTPEIIVPFKVAQKLGLDPHRLRETKIEEYELAGGGKISCYSIPNAVKIRVITEDTKTAESDAVCTIMQAEREVIISDKLASALKIAIEDIGEGLWRFRGEDKLRKSFTPQYW